MIHPKSSDILKVIENFKKVLPKAIHTNHLQMSFGNVNDVPGLCGTVHCHAGWYAIAACDLTHRINYEYGVAQMGTDLGFLDRYGLQNWAMKNPSIWGNNMGWGMFSDPHAFKNYTKRPEGASSLQDIIDHWTEVYERVKALEGSSVPVYSNITKELAVLPTEEVPDKEVIHEMA